MSSKVCSKCKEEKPLEAFGKDRFNKDGLNIYCRVCRNQNAKQYYQDNRDKRLKYDKQYYKDNRQNVLKRKDKYRQNNREQLLEYQKKYYKKNREERLGYAKQYNQDNHQKVSKYRKKYRQSNQEKYRAYSVKRKALKRGAVPEILLNCPIEKDRLEKTYKLRNLLTKTTGVEYHVDHIWPLSKGGPHWSGNLQVITAEENLSKSDSMCEDTARVIQESLDNLLSNAVVMPQEPKTPNREEDFW